MKKRKKPKTKRSMRTRLCWISLKTKKRISIASIKRYWKSFKPSSRKDPKRKN